MGKKATKQQFFARADHLGVAVEDIDGVLTVSTPQGMMWAGEPGTHMLTIAYDHPEGAWRKGEAYAELLHRMQEGLDVCDIEECDYCTE